MSLHDIPQKISRVRVKVGAARNAARDLLASTIARLATGGKVGYGPFKNLTLLSSISHGTSGGNLAAKLLGSYECELHNAIEGIVAANPDLVVNVGAGDGYYVCGLAARLTGSKVIVFEADKPSLDACMLNVQANLLDSRVTAFGLASKGDLNDVINARRTCLLMDCEGAEYDLLDPECVPGLARSIMLVEVHDFVRADIGSSLQERFQATHEILRINQTPRSAPAPGLPKWADPFVHFMQNERRGTALNYWLFFQPQISKYHD